MIYSQFSLFYVINWQLEQIYFDFCVQTNCFSNIDWFSLQFQLESKTFSYPPNFIGINLQNPVQMLEFMAHFDYLKLYWLHSTWTTKKCTFKRCVLFFLNLLIVSKIHKTVWTLLNFVAKSFFIRDRTHVF